MTASQQQPDSRGRLEIELVFFAAAFLSCCSCCWRDLSDQISHIGREKTSPLWMSSCETDVEMTDYVDGD